MGEFEAFCSFPIYNLYEKRHFPCLVGVSTNCSKIVLRFRARKHSRKDNLLSLGDMETNRKAFYQSLIFHKTNPL